MFDTLPTSAFAAMDWGKDDFAPYFQDLLARDLTEATIVPWLLDWTKLAQLGFEVFSRLRVATTVDTSDAEADARLKRFLDEALPALRTYANQLDRKLLESGLEPAGMAVPLRNIRADAALFREENVPLLNEEQKLSLEYNRIIGAQTVEWEGEEVTLLRLNAVGKDPDRERRERAWRLAAERRLADRETLNDLWTRFMRLRGQIAAQAGLPDYRAYIWQDLHRFDYTPEDSATFQQAIEAVVVPAVTRLYARRRAQLGAETLRPWDTDVDPQGRAALRPYDTIDQWLDRTETIFARVDPQLGDYFKIMRAENLLDLENRKGKAPGGYCTQFPLTGRPFIFMNGVGLHGDVQTLAHEGGHSFHAFERFALPYIQQQEITLEFAEVASMAMELLTTPFWSRSEGGFYSEEDAVRARVEHLEEIITFWPYMAVVDAFQHWAYTHHAAATDPANCDAKWGELWDRFMPGLDYSGLDVVKVTGWQRKQHIFRRPFYYIEYGLARLGAAQIWANALRDPAEAVRKYREALALGGTATLPDLFAAAGARFAFDAGTLAEAITLIEATMDALDPA